MVAEAPIAAAEVYAVPPLRPVSLQRYCRPWKASVILKAKEAVLEPELEQSFQVLPSLDHCH